jgi:hypothetical protein
LFGRGAEFRAVAPVDRKGCACRGQALCDGQAKTGAAARDQRNPPAKIERTIAHELIAKR